MIFNNKILGRHQHITDMLQLLQPLPRVLTLHMPAKAPKDTGSEGIWKILTREVREKVKQITLSPALGQMLTVLGKADLIKCNLPSQSMGSS